MKIIDFRLVSIGEAARYYGVSVPTMRRWDKSNRLRVTTRTLGHHRRYQLGDNDRLKVGYGEYRDSDVL